MRLSPWGLIPLIPFAVACTDPDPTPTPTQVPSQAAPTQTPTAAPTEPPTSTLAPPTPASTASPTSPLPTQGDVGLATAREPYGGASIIVEALTAAGWAPSANPLGARPLPTDSGPYDTDEALNIVPYLRYRYAGSEAPVEAIIVGMPGFAGGAGGYDYLARALVSWGEGRVEVWALDRRANLLEDRTGTEAAEASGDIDLGLAYYFEGAEVDGRTFDGFLSNGDVPFLSEWGLEMALRDTHAVIEQVPEHVRSDIVFLAGHSLGGTLVQHYAAMDFDGDPQTQWDAGFNQIAGLILLDGGSSPSTAQDQPTYERELAQVRSKTRYVSFPGLTPDVHALLDLSGMAAIADPNGLARTDTITELPGASGAFLSAIYGEFHYTNRASLGVATDDHFQVAYVQQASMGFISGGPVEPYDVQGSTYYRPAAQGLDLTYGWHDYDVATAPGADRSLEEVSHIDDLAYALHLGPVNFTEWYFPSRLTTDLGPASDFAVAAEADWRATDYGLWLVHNAAVDVPVLGFFGAAEDEASADLLSGYASVISPTLRDGSPREDGFEMWRCGGYEHLDVLTADVANPERGSVVLTRLKTWLQEHQGGSSISWQALTPEAL